MDENIKSIIGLLKGTGKPTTAREIETLAEEHARQQQEIEGFWEHLRYAYNIESREELEKDAKESWTPPNPLVVALHHIWKREPKVGQLQTTIDEKDQLIKQYSKTVKDQAAEIAEMKKQLAEKDKIIDEIISLCGNCRNLSDAQAIAGGQKGTSTKGGCYKCLVDEKDVIVKGMSKTIKEQAAEIVKLMPYEQAIREAHNGYDTNNDFPKPESPKQAIKELLQESEDMANSAINEAVEAKREIERLGVEIAKNARCVCGAQMVIFEGVKGEHEGEYCLICPEEHDESKVHWESVRWYLGKDVLERALAPCKNCVSFITGECTTETHCDTNYSAFKAIKETNDD